MKKPTLLLTAFALSMAAAIVPSRAEDITIKHAQGEIAVPLKPEKVLVFDMASIDTLDALGVEIAGVPGGGKPDYLSKYTGDEYAKVGTLFEPDYEAVNALEPDLIIVGGRSAAKYADLAKFAPTIDLTVDQTNYLDSMRSNVETLADIFGKEAEAEEKLAALTADIEKLNAGAKNAGRVLTVLTTGGRMSAHGEGGRFGIIYDAFGFTPSADGLATGTHGHPREQPGLAVRSRSRRSHRPGRPVRAAATGQ